MVPRDTKPARRIVIVSTFPPRRCGIAHYAQQEVNALRRAGHVVTTVGLPGSRADIVMDLCGRLRLLRLVPIALKADTCELHWHDEFYYRGGPARRLVTHVALFVLLALCGRLTIVCHEIYGPPASLLAPWWRRWPWLLERQLWKAAWARCARFVCHSHAELAAARRAGVAVRSDRVEVRPHGTSFTKYRQLDQWTARAELGLREHVRLLLCIGFLGRHKGFHQAISAFSLAGLATEGTELHVVGSLRDPMDRDSVEYVRRLRELAEATPGVHMHERFVSDEELDTWIVASDVVLAPYEQAFSSSIVARAQMYDRTVIASAVGGLSEQVTAGGLTFAEPAELVKLLRRAQTV